MKLNKVSAWLSRFHFEILAVLWCTAAIAWVALHGLRTGYFPDDLMNMYQGWVKPWSSLALDLVLPSTESYRPTGALVLKLALLVFGLNPLPLRALCLLLIVLNMGLHFSVVRTLSRSNTTAALSICLFAFHACMSDLYLSSATIYDLLAFAFVHTGLLVYIRARENGNRVGWKRWAGIGACLLLASGAKEVGFVLPVLLIGYEVLWKRGEAWSGGGVILLFAFSALRSFWPIVAANGMMQSNPAYSLHLDRASICEMAVSYMRLLLLDMGLAATVAYFVWGAILVLALVWRSPEFRFGALLFFCAAAPLLLIAPRSLYVLYLAYSGWCMLWAAALARIPLPPAVTLVAVAMVFGTWNLRAWPHAISWVPAEQAKVRCAIAAVKPLAPRIKPADRVLITDDPFPADDYLLIFAFRLATGHEDLQAWRLRAHPQAAGWTDPWSMRLRIEGCKAVLEPLGSN